MVLLGHLNDKREASRVCGLLQAAGIPVHVVQEGGLRTPFRAAVFVCLNSQVDDALALLKDPSHGVSSPVDVRAYHESVGKVVAWPALPKLLVILLVLVAVSVAVALATISP